MTSRRSPLIQNNLRATLPIIDRGEGVWLYDDGGKGYLDGCSGAVTTNLGHSHPRVLAAIREQIDRVAFVHRGAFASHGMHSLAARLSDATGYAGAWFVNSGSEAVEAALQFALQYHRERGEQRSVFLSHNRSYHGNTLGALSASGHARRGVLGDLAIDVNVLPDPYTGAPAEQLLAEVRAIVARHPEGVAGILVEPLSGATLGCNPLRDGYLAGLRALTEEYGILLIADEVMTGLGRTGTMLASDHWGVRPDIVALGKGIGAGYTPIAATLLSTHVLETLAEGSGVIRGGHTYGGNPLSVAVADAVLAVTLEEDLVSAAWRMGERLRSELEQLAERHPMIVDVRGKGLLLGIDLSDPGRGSAAAAQPGAGAGTGAGTGSDARPSRVQPPGVGERLRLAALRNGLLIYPTTGGFNEACIVAPPLTVTADEISELMRRLEAAIVEVEGGA